MYCRKPFTEIEIYEDGDVCFCCPIFTDGYYIGNVFEVKSFDEIWYSQKAIDFRKKILNQDYSLCNRKICQKEDCSSEEIYDSVLLQTNPPFPEKIRFSFDTTCSVECIFCRDFNVLNDHLASFYKIIDSILVPLAQKAKVLTINTAGEVTVSPLSKELLRKIVDTTDDLKIEINTNGLYFNEEFINKFKLKNRLCNVVFSLHAATLETYNKIVRKSDFEKVINNIKYLSELKKQGEKVNISCVFVCFSYNYKEIIPFIDLCKSLNVYPLIWEYIPMASAQINKQAEKYMVWKKEHTEYNKFAKIIKKLKKKYKKNQDYRISEELYAVEPISIFEHIRHIVVNKLKNIKLPNRKK